MNTLTQGAAALLATGLLVCLPARAIDYQFSPLSPAVEFSSQPKLNDAGQVAATSFHPRATLWTDGAAVQLPGLQPRAASRAFGIGESGQVVGGWYSVEESNVRATLWNPGQAPVDLGTLGGDRSYATAINERGQIVGVSITAEGNSHAVLWNGSSPTDLGAGLIGSSEARSINRAGHVAGSVYGGGSNMAAVWDSSGRPTVLSVPGGGLSWGLDINNLDQVVGGAFTEDGTRYHATVWNGGVATDLGLLAPDLPENTSEASAINDRGQIVGVTEFGDSERRSVATLWMDGAIIDLNTYLSRNDLLAGWQLTRADDINQSGQIAGIALNSRTGQSHAYLLSPVPEPEVIGLLLAGLALLGSVRRWSGADTTRVAP